MRAVLLHVPESMLEERRRKGHDVWDEVWEGVLHMVPPPSGLHQRFGTELVVALVPLSKARGLVASHETGLFRPGAGQSDYRIPDLVVSRPKNATDQGVEGRAELVVELRSPGDESYEKLSFYSDLEVREALVIDPESCQVELFALSGGRLQAVAADASGSVTSTALAITFTPVEGPALHLSWDGGEAEVSGRIASPPG
ncbi:MAG TPA: Uma2 family endonuclease [Acidimicrobiales bacterium]|nr:Uma2 family endonuclease [Acidimicrobiales bacterium]